MSSPETGRHEPIFSIQHSTFSILLSILSLKHRPHTDAEAVEAVRGWLAGELAAGRVRRVIPGERLSRGDVNEWTRRYAGHAGAFEGLKADAGNAGVTVVELSQTRS